MSESDFIGAYNITIIGGGEKMDKMIQYSNYEQYLYNVKAGSTLIWAGGAAQGYRWLCASGSPCGGITPEFPNTPYYYLMLQFSNEGLENTYCAYTFNFTIMLHGMPPDGLYPSLFIVLLCIFLMMGMLISLYVLEIKYPDVYTDARQWLQNKKTSILSRWRFRNKVGLQSSSKEDGLQSVSSKESILKEHTAKVLQWIDTAPEHPQNIP